MIDMKLLTLLIPEESTVMWGLGGEISVGFPLYQAVDVEFRLWPGDRSRWWARRARPIAPSETRPAAAWTPQEARQWRHFWEGIVQICTIPELRRTDRPIPWGAVLTHLSWQVRGLDRGMALVRTLPVEEQASLYIAYQHLTRDQQLTTHDLEWAAWHWPRPEKQAVIKAILARVAELPEDVQPDIQGTEVDEE